MSSNAITTPRTRARKSLPPIKDMMLRSTIYNRHEARRAKTLLRQGDKRPALLRVFAPPATAAGLNADPNATSTTNKNPHLSPNHWNNDGEQQQRLQEPIFSDESVFTRYDMPNATRTPIKQTSVMASMVAASVGAVLSEAAYGASCLQQASSPFASSPRGTKTVPGQPRVVVSDTSLMLQHTTKRSAPQFLFQGSTTGGLSNIQLASRAAPFALLFGVKSFMEHLLINNSSSSNHRGKKITPPAAAISFLASATAGSVLGGLRSVVNITSRPSMTGSSVVGREIAGATLYFTVYDSVRHVLVNGNKSSINNDQQQHQQLKGASTALNPLATIAAGAVAGVLYDGIRICGQTAGKTSPSTLATSAAVPVPSFATVAIRAAPSHALLFLGYEATLRLVAA